MLFVLQNQSFVTNLFSEFSRLFHCSVINVLRFQAFVSLSATFYILSHLSMSVNIFFQTVFFFLQFLFQSTEQENDEIVCYLAELFKHFKQLSADLD